MIRLVNDVCESKRRNRTLVYCGSPSQQSHIKSPSYYLHPRLSPISQRTYVQKAQRRDSSLLLPGEGHGDRRKSRRDEEPRTRKDGSFVGCREPARRRDGNCASNRFRFGRGGRGFWRCGRRSDSMLVLHCGYCYHRLIVRLMR